MSQVADTFLSRPREQSKKGGARKLRAQGWIPAVAYGPSQAPRHLAVDPKTFLLARMAHGAAHIYQVQIEGEGSFKALVKSVDRDPVTRELLHVDLYAVDMSKPIRVKVAIELTGKAAGVVHGGILQQVLHAIEVIALPDRIPDKLFVDVSPLNIGDGLHLHDIALPEGVRLTTTEDEAVVILTQPAAEEEVKPAAEAAAEGAVPAEGAEGAAAAPAAEPEKK